MATALVYPFGVGYSQSQQAKEVVGGKGAALIQMAALGLPVPPGVVVPTSECSLYLSPNFSVALKKQQLDQLAGVVLKHFEEHVVPVLGYMPLVSVRSGARVSMPGMMDTILNIGLTSENASEWKKRLGAACYKDCLHRLGDMYVRTVNAPVPLTVREQIAGAIGAVFESWNSERAKEYRKMHGYPDDWGTAVTVQAMVFGNLNTESGSGVLFTRDPATGENFVVGEYLPKAQGEDVVSGVRTPLALHLMEEWQPAVLEELLTFSGKLEEHYKDAQDIEFTVQDKKLWILQTRNAKRTAEAAFKIAHDLAVEGVIKKTEAVKRVSAEQYQMLLRPRLDPEFKQPSLFAGLPASPGLVRGVATFDPAQVTEKSILIRKETSPDDFPAMVKSAAILTSTGGSTSHAAVVARGINKPAVVGASTLTLHDWYALVETPEKTIQINAGDAIALCGSTGRVWLGDVPVVGGGGTPEAEAVVEWGVQQANVIKAIGVGSVEQLPTRGRVYLSVAGLASAAEYRKLFKALAARPDLHGVVGYERASVALSPEDVEYLELLAAPSVATTSGGPQTPALLKALVSSSVQQKVKKRWLVHLPMDAATMQIETVADAGWSQVRPVRTLADLLAADGPVVFGPEFRERMQAEQVSVEEILLMLKKAGRPVSEFSSILGDGDFVSGVLGK